MPRYKPVPEQYKRKCGHCHKVIIIKITMKTATYVYPGIGKDVTHISITRKRGKRGDRHGLTTSVLWMCPSCGHTHNNVFFTPDDQMDFFALFDASERR